MDSTSLKLLQMEVIFNEKRPLLMLERLKLSDELLHSGTVMRAPTDAIRTSVTEVK